MVYSLETILYNRYEYDLVTIRLTIRFDIHPKSRNEYPAEARYISSAADAFVKVVHGKSNAAIIAETQASAGPYNDTPRRALANDAHRACFFRARCIFSLRGIRSFSTRGDSR